MFGSHSGKLFSPSERSLMVETYPEAELQEYERLIGLPEPNPEFRERVAVAVYGAGLLHRAEPKGPDVVRDKGKLIAKSAHDAAASLQRLAEALGQATFLEEEELPEPLTTLIAPGNQRALRRLAEAAARGTGLMKGKHSKAVGLEYLIRALATAYTCATGRPAGVTWNSYHGQYEGRFVALAERAVKKVEQVAAGFAPEDAAKRHTAIREILRGRRTAKRTPRPERSERGGGGEYQDD